MLALRLSLHYWAHKIHPILASLAVLHSNQQSLHAARQEKREGGEKREGKYVVHHVTHLKVNPEVNEKRGGC